MNPHITFSALLGLGLRGIKLQLPLSQPPLSTSSLSAQEGVAKLERLPRTLRDATERFVAEGSKAREVLGDRFVEHYGSTRVRAISLVDSLHFSPSRFFPTPSYVRRLDRSHLNERTDVPLSPSFVTPLFSSPSTSLLVAAKRVGPLRASRHGLGAQALRRAGLGALRNVVES
jgi:hypothetical protein